jgi:hypothetical protein
MSGTVRQGRVYWNRPIFSISTFIIGLLVRLTAYRRVRMT